MEDAAEDDPIRQAEQVWRACISKSSRVAKEYNFVQKNPALAGALLALQLSASQCGVSGEGATPPVPLPDDVAMCVWRLLSACIKCHTAGSIPATCMTAVEYDTTGELQFRVQAEDRLCGLCVEPVLLQRSASGNDCQVMKGSAINAEDPQCALSLVLAQSQLLILKGVSARASRLVLELADRHINDTAFKLGGVRPAPLSSGVHFVGRHSGFDAPRMTLDVLHADLLRASQVRRIAFTEYQVDDDVVAALATVPLTHLAVPTRDDPFAYYPDSMAEVNLRWLHVRYVQRGTGLCVVNLRHLRTLILERVNDTLPAMVAIGSLTQLEELKLTECDNFDDSHLLALVPAACTGLVKLSVSGRSNALSNESLSILMGWQRLRSLRLNFESRLPYEFVQIALVSLANVEMLSLGECPAFDYSLQLTARAAHGLRPFDYVEVWTTGLYSGSVRVKRPLPDNLYIAQRGPYGGPLHGVQRSFW